MKQSTVNVILCALSIALLAVLGLLGEEIQSLARGMARVGCGAATSNLPYPTRLAFDIFGQHTGSFLLSLTPLMIGFGIIAAGAFDASRSSTFWSVFAATWLAALIYFGLYTWAMLLPFSSLCSEFETTPVAWIILLLDAVLLAVGFAAVQRSRRAP